MYEYVWEFISIYEYVEICMSIYLWEWLSIRVQITDQVMRSLEPHILEARMILDLSLLRVVSHLLMHSSVLPCVSAEVGTGYLCKGKQMRNLRMYANMWDEKIEGMHMTWVCKSEMSREEQEKMNEHAQMNLHFGSVHKVASTLVKVIVHLLTAFIHGILHAPCHSTQAYFRYHKIWAAQPLQFHSIGDRGRGHVQFHSLYHHWKNHKKKTKHK